MKTLSELLALTDAERAVLFYRAVLGWSVQDTEPASDNHTVFRYALVPPDKKAIGFYPSVSMAEERIPPVSNEAWLAAMDELRALEVDFVLGQNHVYVLQGDKALITLSDNVRSEALRRAVEIAAIYSKQQRAT